VPDRAAGGSDRGRWRSGDQKRAPLPIATENVTCQHKATENVEILYLLPPLRRTIGRYPHPGPLRRRPSGRETDLRS
jgi:hypothetical protein